MYALDTQMGTNYKAELIPQRTRDAIHGWGKEARRRRKRLVIYGDDSTFHTDTSTMVHLLCKWVITKGLGFLTSSSG
ncbi:hypothetical protein HanRHA438_Chr13g0615761 [Helianthus annuus]|uniref:Uncharacterized protein n=1 Tax=Helianthus annuus TaxID=4232 RepID=A0A9K3EMX2_HELAN|nr:hypothetical protein HanXRQr2_Chr13g0605351 [Helianthus annuus]KAJ0478097.1 hypothetical protein HanHA300_Chr13g0496381 [Helianthus annuus]KAJ0482757.1 hypothetical protein HanIR_Chr13g0657441 [Helianthus annuus]KAJ0498975.1 hypothetical protein HanHA89_Chr13g0529001 [Helianthus annuus]KAJ0664990.1 hypothetical protein HanLR1_Chr13g0499031 [Helianthus annuus]